MAVLAVVGLALIVVAAASLFDLAQPEPTMAVDGVIVGVRSEGLTRVRGFTLRTTDQGTLEFVLGDLENGTVFPPGHLVEHQAAGLPVRVWYRLEGDERVAVRLEDAPR